MYSQVTGFLFIAPPSPPPTLLVSGPARSGVSLWPRCHVLTRWMAPLCGTPDDHICLLWSVPLQCARPALRSPLGSTLEVLVPFLLPRFGAVGTEPSPAILPSFAFVWNFSGLRLTAARTRVAVVLGFLGVFAAAVPVPTPVR